MLNTFILVIQICNGKTSLYLTYLQMTLSLPPANSPISPRRWKSRTIISSFWHWRAMCVPLPSGSILTTELSGCLLRRKTYKRRKKLLKIICSIVCSFHFYILGRGDWLLQDRPWAFWGWWWEGPSQHHSRQTDHLLSRREYCHWSQGHCLSLSIDQTSDW